MFSASAIVTLLPALAAILFAPGAHSHNIVLCSNSKPADLNLLLSRPTEGYDSSKDVCSGYPRAIPADGTPQAGLVSDQGYPWQGIWPIQDGMGYKTHRAVNWLQQNPVYDPTKKWTTVKPGATFFINVQTNNHAHEYATRPSGHYKIYLAGSSMTQITTSDQLTDDRVVFKAPANKYAHIIGTPNFGGYGGDPGASWLPLKMVDPTGAPLPPGVYNFVWTYWWATSEPPQVDYMVPAYSSGFDIEISEDADDEGFLTQAVNANPNYHITLIGNTTSPGALDHTSPWPPYAPGYLDSNYDGTDPSTADGKDTFAPYWHKHIDATPMAAPSLQTIGSIKDWTEDQRQVILALPPGSDLATWPAGNADVGNITAGTGDSVPAPVVDAVGLGDSGTAASNATIVPLASGATNGTTPYGTSGGNSSEFVDSAAYNGTTAAEGSAMNGTATSGTEAAPAGNDTTPAYTDPAPAGNDTTPAGTDTTPAGTDPAPAGNDTAPSSECPSVATVPQYWSFDECHWVSDEANTTASAGTDPGPAGNDTATMPTQGDSYTAPGGSGAEANTSTSAATTPDNFVSLSSENDTAYSSSGTDTGPIGTATLPGNDTTPSGTETGPAGNGTTPSDECEWVSDEKNSTSASDECHWVSDEKNSTSASDECHWVSDEKNKTISAATGPGLAGSGMHHADNKTAPSGECKWVPAAPLALNSTVKKYRPRDTSW